MRIISKYIALVVLMLLCGVFAAVAQKQATQTTLSSKKISIYQLLPRLFGNTNPANIPYGTIGQNGCGKFDDINNKALKGIKELGITHVWYTGIIAHASLTDYSAYGIKPDDADVVKGRAGSPYAIRDYYDVDPDLAVDVKNRMAEFEALLSRTHQNGLKAIIDFVPNHVARSYHSMARPKGVDDFGAHDDVTKAFSPLNDFYYIPGKAFVVPTDGDVQVNPLSSLKDGKFEENPAKATGNSIFSEHPSANDWYETIKLNYGVDYSDGAKEYFNPRPPVWTKMRDILLYWADKGVDGFRCDVAEMVPVAFWNWVIPEIKKVHPHIIFIGEAYDPKAYATYLHTGKFDFLYDKVGLYDGLKRLVKNESTANVNDIQQVWKKESAGFGDHMLRFMENHDEERIASAGFAGNASYALPAMVVSATLGAGPIMLYFGQEVGEPAKGKEGFGGDDNRTTIFDYWGVPEHQKWVNKGAFDGALLSKEQVKLRNFYKKLLHIAGNADAIKNGKLYEIPFSTKMNNRMYGYVRYTEKQRFLVLVNFDRNKSLETSIVMPSPILKNKKIGSAVDLLTDQHIRTSNRTIHVKVPPVSAQVIEF